MKTKLFLFAMIVFALIPQLAIAATQDLTYDNPTNQVNITYDALNRIVTKNSTGISINYTYDEQHQGTLTNVTFGNDTVKYEYNDKLRLITEIRIIDGIQFEKRYVYDSMDRVLEINLTGQEIEYYYNNQSKVNKITNYITNTFYDAFDKMLNRTYANTRITEQTYNETNSRLQQIKTGAIQNINYTYDSVGNIVLINDTANNRTYRMAYDFLDRLVNVSIAGNTWLYSYNPIGNILKIVRDSANTTKFVYGSYPVHAPSQIVTVDAGVDVSRQENLYSADRNRTFQFYLANEKNSTITDVNWTADFGDGNQIISTNAFNVSTNESVLVIVEHNYSSGGSYKVNVTARSNPGSYDFENITNKFGITIGSLSFISQNGDKANFNMTILNGLNSTVSNMDWACDNGAKSNSSFSVSAFGRRTEYLNRTYGSPGAKYLNCNVTSPEGNDTKFVKFELKGTKIEDYNTSSVGENNRNMQFNIKNYWSALTVTYNIRSDDQLFSGSTGSLGTDASSTVTQSINYTTDGNKDVNVTIVSGAISDRFNESFVLNAIRIENFESYKKNETNIRVFRFNITNYWPYNVSNINWRISDAGVTSNTSVTLAPRETTNFTVEVNYSAQGKRTPAVQAYNGTFNNSFADKFQVNMIEVLGGLVLKENKDSTVQVFEIVNNLGSQIFSWLFNTGQSNIHSTQTTSLNNSEKVFVIIETDYTTNAIYTPNITVNQTSYNDTFQTVVSN